MNFGRWAIGLATLSLILFWLHPIGWLFFLGALIMTALGWKKDKLTKIAAIILALQVIVALIIALDLLMLSQEGCAINEDFICSVELDGDILVVHLHSQNDVENVRMKVSTGCEGEATFSSMKARSQETVHICRGDERPLQADIQVTYEKDEVPLTTFGTLELS